MYLDVSSCAFVAFTPERASDREKVNLCILKSVNSDSGCLDVEIS
jgi:hypothetical protein